MKRDGGPAFPHTNTTDLAGMQIVNGVDPGMTLRDYFAGQALVGLANHCSPGSNCGACAIHAYTIADAMIAERERE